MVFGFGSRENAETERVYYWIRANLEGKMFMTGPYLDEQEAYQDGNTKLGEDFDVVPLRTRDPRRARSILLRSRIDEGEEPIEVMGSRIKHVI